MVSLRSTVAVAAIFGSVMSVVPLRAQQTVPDFPIGAIKLPPPAPPRGTLSSPVAPPIRPGQRTAASLESPLQLVDNSHPNIAQAAVQVRGEEGKARQAGLWCNPGIRYEGNGIAVHPEGRNAGVGRTNGRRFPGPQYLTTYRDSGQAPLEPVQHVEDYRESSKATSRREKTGQRFSRYRGPMKTGTKSKFETCRPDEKPKLRSTVFY
jgi:hypothetical protein